MNHAQRMKMGVALAPASQTAAATRSANIDVIGADYATIVVNLGAQVNTSANAPTVAITEADVTNYTSMATWSSSFSGTKSLTNAHQEVYHVDCKSRKRYLNVALTTGTHTTNDVITAGVTYILSKRERVDAGTAAMVASTNDAVTVG